MPNISPPHSSGILAKEYENNDNSGDDCHYDPGNAESQGDLAADPGSVPVPWGYRYGQGREDDRHYTWGQTDREETVTTVLKCTSSYMYV